MSADSAALAHPLLDAFLSALNLNGQERSRAALLSGLPHQESISFELLARASQRLGLEVEQVDSVSDLIPQRVHPMIVRFQQGEHQGAFGVVPAGVGQQQQPIKVRVFKTATDESVVGQDVEFDQAELLQLTSPEGLLVKRPMDTSAVDDHSGHTFSQWLFAQWFRMRGVYRDVLLASILLNLFIIASPLFVMNVYDRVVPNQAFETLWVLALGVVVVFVFDLVIKLLRHFFIEVSGRQLDVVLSTQLFERVMSLKVDQLPHSVGAFASHFRDFDAIKQFFTASTLTALVDLPFTVILLLIIYSLGGPLVWVPCLFGVVIVVYGVLIHFPLKAAVEKSQQMMAQKNATLIESLSTVETLKAFNAEGRAQDKWEQLTIYLAGLGLSVRRLADSIAIVSQFLIQLAVVVVVVGGVYQISAHQMSLGALIACVLLSSRALAPLVQVAALAAQYYQARSALEGLNHLTRLALEQGPSQRYIRRESFEGEIEFKGLSFDYGDRYDALKELNLRIRPGEHVALIGKIGSGKSSLLRLLLAMGQANRGQLTIDGIDVAQLNPIELRAALAYVPQDVVLVSGTLRENLALKQPTANEAALMAAADVAGLGDFIRSHAMGLDLPIGEQGKGLSGGQRQSVAIARAILGQASIFLLDEPTSAMDNQTESSVIAKLKSLAEGKTLIVSTHRASLLNLVDRVIVLDEGRVVADGPKDKVIDALKKGLINTGKQA